MKKIVKYRFFWPGITFFAIIPSFIFLLKPKTYYNMHDDMQMIRQLEMEKCINDGQIPCRWTPDLGYGYGYPLFNYYPPSPYIVGQVFRFVGFSFADSVKATAVCQIVLSAMFMYLLASSIFGPIGGFISSIFYTYAPYHAVNIYVRGAMNEAWAAVFFPLIFYYSRKLILEKKTKYTIGLGISFAFLLLSHNPMVLTFTPILLLWVLFWIFSRYILNNKYSFKLFIKYFYRQLPIILKLIFSSIIAISLTAFYTLPVLLESKYVQIDSMFTGYFDFSVHFTSLYQLFISNFWNDGPSTWGPYDEMSFMVGYLHWIIPLLLLIYLIYVFFRNKKIFKKDIRYFLIVLLNFLGFFTIFMTHNKSTWIWLMFPIIQKIQFPWRLLNHSIFLLSLSIGGLVLILEKFLLKKIIFLLFLIYFFLVLLNISFFTPVNYGPIDEAKKFSGDSWKNQITAGIYDYLPKTADIAALGPAKDYIDEVSPIDSFYTISNGKKGTDWMFFNLHLSRDSRVTLAQLGFPRFEVISNNKIIPTEIEPKLGRLVINLPSGDHQIMVKLKDTPVRTISNYISLISWIFLILYLSKPLWLLLIYKK